MNVKCCLLLSSSCAFSILLFSLILSPISRSTSLNIFTTTSKPYRLTYSNHIENHCKWALGIPANENLIANQTANN